MLAWGSFTKFSARCRTRGDTMHYNDAWLAWLYIGGCAFVILAVFAIVSKGVDDLFGK